MRKNILFVSVVAFALVLLTNHTSILSAGSAPSLSYQVVVKETVVDSTPAKQLQVKCPGTKKALGAGWAVLDPTGAYLEGRATAFEPAFDGSSWLVNAQNDSRSFAPTWKLRVRVICARVP
jgi:hypothetical protein